MDTDKHITGEIDPLLIRCLDGTASAADYTFAWEWIRKNDQNKIYYEQMRDVWISASVIAEEEDHRTQQSWFRFRSKIPGIASGQDNMINTMPRVTYWYLKIAATIVFAFLAGGLASYVIQNQSAHNHENDTYLVEAPRGAKSFVALSDGSEIWLNAGSKITYQRNYNQKNRDIILEGEAYFIVAKNKGIPFYVYSSGLAIRAVGTAFNVKAYPEEETIETTLVEGEVSIESTGKAGKKEKIFIQPNQKASFYKMSNHFTIVSGTAKKVVADSKMTKIARIEVAKKVNTELYTSWKDKRWIFKKQKLGDFAIMLERLYDVKILFKDEELKQYSLSGSFEEENLEQVLKAVQLTVPLDYSIQHREVYLSINREMRSSYKKILKSVNTN